MGHKIHAVLATAFDPHARHHTTRCSHTSWDVDPTGLVDWEHPDICKPCRRNAENEPKGFARRDPAVVAEAIEIATASTTDDLDAVASITVDHDRVTIDLCDVVVAGIDRPGRFIFGFETTRVRGTFEALVYEPADPGRIPADVFDAPEVDGLVAYARARLDVAPR